VHEKKRVRDISICRSLVVIDWDQAIFFVSIVYGSRVSWIQFVINLKYGGMNENNSGYFALSYSIVSPNGHIVCLATPPDLKSRI
jgi:hypothetical protein